MDTGVKAVFERFGHIDEELTQGQEDGARKLLDQYEDKIENELGISGVGVPHVRRFNELSDREQMRLRDQASVNDKEIDNLGAQFLTDYETGLDGALIIMFPAIEEFPALHYPIAHEYGHYLDHELIDWMDFRHMLSIEMDVHKEEFADAVGRWLANESMSAQDEQIMDNLRNLFQE